ncbi:siderophore-interacting protein [Pseudonocardiaceae bacterium YIM PH 21723]|nr:siderophore-interacting protein [Pseudonocardiaceae bacterium YIM PH 21723]
MSDRRSVVHIGRVLRTETVNPHLIRVVLGGDGLSEFGLGEHSDAYVKLQFPRDGVTYPEPFDLTTIRQTMPREQWPVVRTYTVRHWDEQARELCIDFVWHGDEGIAGPWAANAQPGDELIFAGPGGAYHPREDYDWHLLAGDEAALPAIAASLEALPPGAVAKVYLEVEGPEDELQLKSAGDVQVHWVHRGSTVPGRRLEDAVLGAEWLSGRVQAFIHGEAHFVKAVRKYLRVDRDMPRGDLSISGYWRLGVTEDGWQASKPEWNKRIEQEEEVLVKIAS